jgi:hypothetical protein
MFGKLFKYWKTGSYPVMLVFAFSYIVTIIQAKEFIFATLIFSAVFPIMIGYLLISFKSPKTKS